MIDLISGFAFKSKDYTQNPDDVRLCGGLIIMPWGIEWEKSNRWNVKKDENLTKYFLQKNDIVMALDGVHGLTQDLKLQCFPISTHHHFWFKEQLEFEPNQSIKLIYSICY